MKCLGKGTAGAEVLAGYKPGHLETINNQIPGHCLGLFLRTWNDYIFLKVSSRGPFSPPMSWLGSHFLFSENRLQRFLIRRKKPVL